MIVRFYDENTIDIPSQVLYNTATNIEMKLVWEELECISGLLKITSRQFLEYYATIAIFAMDYMDIVHITKHNLVGCIRVELMSRLYQSRVLNRWTNIPLTETTRIGKIIFRVLPLHHTAMHNWNLH